MTAARNALIELRGISKRFGDVVALDGVDFTIRTGEIHGLLGENGAGKSTLMNVLYGLYEPDEGVLRIEGGERRLSSPAESIRAGIGMVHQVSTLVPEFTALENIVMGTRVNRTHPRGARSGPRAERARVETLAQRFGMRLPLDARVSGLPAGVKQKVEIVRALFRGARLLILDEPTTSLVEQEFEQLLTSLKSLVREGMGVVFITHKIREVMLACDAATVLRRGRVQGVFSREQMTSGRLVGLMFADREITIDESALPSVFLPPARKSDTPVLEMREVTTVGDAGSPGLKGVSLEVYGGEIVGVAAVSGNGEKALAEVIVNPRRASGGDLRLHGDALNGCSTLSVLGKGVAYTPEDRMAEGILNEASITENIVLGHHTESRFLRHRTFISWKAARESAEEAVREYRIQTPGVRLPARRLSGGNIQKLLIARALSGDTKLLVTHNPTSGLDIATVEFIFSQLCRIRDEGAAVLWINEDLDELMKLSDRVVVLHDGRISGSFEREQFDKYQIGLRMLGGES